MKLTPGPSTDDKVAAVRYLDRGISLPATRFVVQIQYANSSVEWSSRGAFPTRAEAKALFDRIEAFIKQPPPGPEVEEYRL